MKTRILLSILLLISLLSYSQNSKSTKNNSGFSIVFMTDIHIQPELNAVDGFRKAVDHVNKLKPDLVITGGDLIMDALAVNQQRADSLYALYNKEVKRLAMPVYNTIGNHELFGVYRESGVDTTHELYGNRMFKQRIGKNYYSFTHKGWKFIVLDAIYATPDRKYKGFVSSDQIEWIKAELKNTGNTIPIVIVVHIPLLSSISQFNKGATAANSDGLVIGNSKEVLGLFNNHNLKLVLQGHLHILEDNYIGNIHFITGGAVCGKWWEGPNEGTEEGFLHINFKNNNFDWKYIDYGWEPLNTGK